MDVAPVGYPGKWVPILRPKSRDGMIRARLLGDFMSVLVHWTKEDGSVPCYGSRCILCPKRVITKWYAPALNPRFVDGTGFVYKPAIVELYDKNYLEQMDGAPGRGLEIEVSKASSGALILRIVQRLDLEAQKRLLLPAFDVQPFLEKMFGMPLAPNTEEQEAPPDVLKFRRQA